MDLMKEGRQMDVADGVHRYWDFPMEESYVLTLSETQGGLNQDQRPPTLEI
jgi:hypothetical protein